MTRTTSFLMPKRHHLPASSFEEMQGATAAGPSSNATNDGDPSKKRKRTTNNDRGSRKTDAQEGFAARKAWGKDPNVAKRAEQTEKRRLDRQNSRQSDLTCFACRSRGHSARECPNVLLAQQAEGGDAAGEGQDQQPKQQGMKRAKGKMGSDVAGAGGRCYRCDSSQHPLSRCPKPASIGLPFATCFICLDKGHLASTCPQSTRGIYPNGGSCKVCGSVQHRAYDCPDDKRGKKAESEEPAGPALEAGDEELLGQGVLGVGSRDVGADEDDFMAAKRRKDVVDRVKAEKKAEEKKKKQALKEAKVKASQVQRDLPQHATSFEQNTTESLVEDNAVKPSAATAKTTPPVNKPKVVVPPRSKPKIVTF